MKKLWFVAVLLALLFAVPAKAGDNLCPRDYNCEGVAVHSAVDDGLVSAPRGLHFDFSLRFGVGVVASLQKSESAPALVDYGFGLFSLDGGRVRTLGFTVIIASNSGWNLHRTKSSAGLGIPLVDVRVVKGLYFGVVLARQFEFEGALRRGSRNVVYFSLSGQIGKYD